MKTPFRILILTGIFAMVLVSCSQDKLTSQKRISYPEFYHGCNQVKVYLDQGQLELAMKRFDEIATQVPNVPSRYYYTLAHKAAENERCTQAAKYLKKAIINGSEYGGHKSEFEKIPCNAETSNILAKENEIHAKYFNYEYKSTIDSMYARDLKIRALNDASIIAQHDSTNMAKLMELYNNYGYPGEKIVGSISAKSANILLLITDPNNSRNNILSIFKKAYNDGHLTARTYAGLSDRKRSRGVNYTAPYYYEMPTSDYKDMLEIEKAEIDRRRDSIGLAPIPRTK